MALTNEFAKLEAPMTVAPKPLQSTVRWIKLPSPSAPPKGRGPKALDEWFAENEDALLRAAEANCLRLTGKPSL